MASSRWLSCPWAVARSVLGEAWVVMGPPLGPHGLDPNRTPWALMGRALGGPAGPSLAPLCPCGPGPCEPSWALVGRALVDRAVCPSAGPFTTPLIGYSAPS